MLHSRPYTLWPDHEALNQVLQGHPKPQARQDLLLFPAKPGTGGP